MIPPNACTDAEVPLMIVKVPLLDWQFPAEEIQSTYPSWSAALTATSGTKRAFAVGIPVTPDCQNGFEKNMLWPPPLDHRPTAVQLGPTVVQLSFQTFSGM